MGTVVSQKSYSFNHRLGSHGFGLVEVMVSASILSVVALGMTSFMSRVSQNQLSQRLVATRDDLKHKLENYGKNGAILYQLTRNTTPSIVAVNGVAAGFNDCATNKNCGVGTANQKGFYFVDPSNVTIGGPVNTTYFTADGAACAGPAAGNCYLMVETDVYTTTPACAAPTCATSSTMTISYSITQTANNSNVTLKAATGTMTVSLPITSTSGGAGSVTTGSPYYLSKYDSTGSNIISTSKVYEDTTGKVGLGTTAPVSQLNVVYDSTSAMTLTTGGFHMSSSGPYGSVITLESLDTGGKSWSLLSTGSGNYTGAGYLGIFDNSVNASTSYKFVVNPNGYVAIDQMVATYPLDINGDVRSTSCYRAGATGATIVGGTCTSDERIKTDIKPFGLGLNELLRISPKTFRYNGLGEVSESKEPSVGVIAQEVEKAAPTLVSERAVKLHPEDTGKTLIKQVDYSSFTYILINGVKEFYHLWHQDSGLLHEQISSLEAENAQLKAENQQIRTYLCAKDPAAALCQP